MTEVGKEESRTFPRGCGVDMAQCTALPSPRLVSIRSEKRRPTRPAVPISTNGRGVRAAVLSNTNWFTVVTTEVATQRVRAQRGAGGAAFKVPKCKHSRTTSQAGRFTIGRRSGAQSLRGDPTCKMNQLRSCGPDLDYLHKWANKLKVGDLLECAFKESA